MACYSRGQWIVLTVVVVEEVVVVVVAVEGLISLLLAITRELAA